MALHITTADERLAQPAKVNVVMVAPYGVGKTFQARYLDPKTTLYVDYESGTNTLNGDTRLKDGTVVPEWRGDIIKVREQSARLGVHPWEFTRALTCILSGPDPAARPGSPYAADMYENYQRALRPASDFAKYTTIFKDSLTVASRYSFSWSQMQPEAFSDKTGKPDTRGAYGLHGREMVTWFTQSHHIPGKSIIMVALLNVIRDPDIPSRVSYELQIEGSKAGRELPGIFDQVITLGRFSVDATNKQFVMDMEKGEDRAFVCHQGNGFGVPAKSRAGNLDLLEPPNLGALLKKIATAPRSDAAALAGPVITPT